MQLHNNEYATFCNCTGTPPWPGMVRLNTAGQNQYFVCRECGAICEHLRRPDGSVIEVRWHEAGRPNDLPAIIIKQARSVVERVEPEMVTIPAGEFLMGSTDADLDAMLENCSDSKREWYSGEQPQHIVYLPDYAIAKTPVTNAQYKTFIRATGHSMPRHWENGRPPFGAEDYPVVAVSWHDGMAYCRWLAEITGKPYSLPSEAQWEKAARGTDGRLYPWGDEFDSGKCNCSEAVTGHTTPVEAYAQGASPYGVLDMVGNVWEWTRSIYKEYPYTLEDGREDLVEGRRALRGGAFYYSRYDVRCAFRSSYKPDARHDLIGFRPVISPPSTNEKRMNE